MSLSNTNSSQNSGITSETRRAIKSEITSLVSRNLEGTRSDLNSHILDAINPAVAEKMLPSVQKARRTQNSDSYMKVDTRSDEPQQRQNTETSHKIREDFPKIGLGKRTQNNHR